MSAAPGAAIARFCWPRERAGEALAALARSAGLDPRAHDPLAPPPLAETGELARWIRFAAGRMGIDADEVETAVPEAQQMLLGAGPALLELVVGGATCFVALLGARGGMLRLVGPDLALHRCPATLLRAALCAVHEAPLAREIDRLLDLSAVPPARRARVRSALLAERLATERVGRCWMLGLPPAASWWRQLARARVPHRTGLALGLIAVLSACELLGWRLVGSAALDGHADPGWLAAWVLLLLTMVPLRFAGGWLDAGTALDVSQAFKRRLMAAALGGEHQWIKRQGVGHLLTRVMEAQALESLALDGGLSLLVALIELGFAAWLLAAGAGGAPHAALLVLWLGVSALFGWRFFGGLRAWTDTRLSMTHELVERMMGHRTCLAQEWPSRRDARHDGTLRDYAEVSRRFDRAAVLVGTLGPGGWMLAGLAGLVPPFVAGAGAASLAIGFGGVLLAGRAFAGLAGAFAVLARAAIAWQNVARMGRSPPPDTGEFLPGLVGGDAPQPLAEACNLVFRHVPHGAQVLRGASLAIRHGDRILLQGASGGGKSTLAALLAGLHAPESGLLLIHGLDRGALGQDWHRLAAAAPQFHENHILSGSLGFNLLMGRNWPATEAELLEARALCEELGLGALIERMPSGLLQVVGETGWQLSHGERSRVFLARALLQQAPLTILDESFAALDPETLETCLGCVLRRAGALLVIAHP